MKANFDLLEVPELVDELRWVVAHLEHGPIRILISEIVKRLDVALGAVTEHCCPSCAAASPLARLDRFQHELLVLSASHRDGLLDDADVWALTAEVLREARTSQPHHSTARAGV